jgi:hypothetical protein
MRTKTLDNEQRADAEQKALNPTARSKRGDGFSLLLFCRRSTTGPSVTDSVTSTRKDNVMFHFRSPLLHQPHPKFQTHVQAHEAVTNNESWYTNKPPNLGQGFSAADVAERRTTVMEILLRAAKRADKKKDVDLAAAFYQVYDRLEACVLFDRCGSLACPCCARAFQKAKVVAQEEAIVQATKRRADMQLVFVTLIPPHMMYAPGEFHKIDLKKANRGLKDALRSAVGKRMIFGSADLGWETRRDEGYIQVHWHLAMWTRNPGGLAEKLKAAFGKTKKYERPVDVREAVDFGFLSYMNKAIKWAELLRTNRKLLPELLLVLDQVGPLDLMVFMGSRLIAQSGQLAFKPIGRGEE